MTISIAMPYHNREPELIRGIESILKHTPELDLKFSIACDRSRPPLSELAFPKVWRDLVMINWIQGTPEPRNPCVPINLAVTGPLFIKNRRQSSSPGRKWFTLRTF